LFYASAALQEFEAGTVGQRSYYQPEQTAENYEGTDTSTKNTMPDDLNESKGKATWEEVENTLRLLSQGKDPNTALAKRLKDMLIDRIRNGYTSNINGPIHGDPSFTERLEEGYKPRTRTIQAQSGFDIQYTPSEEFEKTYKNGKLRPSALYKRLANLIADTVATGEEIIEGDKVYYIKPREGKFHIVEAKEGEVYRHYLKGESFVNQKREKGKKGHSRSGTYSDRAYQARGDKPFSDSPKGQQHRLELPELYKLAKILMGKAPVVKRLINEFGVFSALRGDPRISLNRMMFKNPDFVAGVLAHEIGHLSDWLSGFENTMARGNILGRIASLKKYMKHLLEEFPGGPAVLTEQDKNRLRKEARRQLREEEKLGAREVIEEIIREVPIFAEVGITAEDILAVWNTMEAGKDNPALYEFIAKLSRAEKVAIVKKATKGIVDEFIKEQFGKKRVGTKTIKETVKKTIYPDNVTRENINARFKELLEEEIQKRGLWKKQVIEEELRNLTMWWNPFDERLDPKYTAYRYSSPELYAEAMSVLINNPTDLMDKAPNFYHAFWNYIDNKPDVKQALFELTEFLMLPEVEKAKIYYKDWIESFEKGEEAWFEARTKYRQMQKSFRYRFKYAFENAYPILEKIHQLEKLGQKVNPEDNPAYYFWEYSHIGGVIKNLSDDIDNVLQYLADNGIAEDDLNVYLANRRIITDRNEIANPMGHTYRSAMTTIEGLRAKLGNQKFVILDEAKNKFRRIVEKVLDDAYQAGIIDEEKWTNLRENTDYATFAVVDYLDNYISSSFIKQVGTFKEIARPFTATYMKMVSLVRATKRNIVRQKFVEFLAKNFKEDIKKATVHFVPGSQPNIKEEYGKGIVKVMIGGKLNAFYIDPYIAEMLNYTPHGYQSIILSSLSWLNRSYFRPIFVGINVGFQSFNLLRDFFRAWKNTPGLSLWRQIQLYYQALPEAKKKAFGDITPEIVREMQDKGVLSFSYNDISRTEQFDEESQIEYLLRKFDVNKKTKDNIFIKTINFIENMGDMIEALPKISGYKYRKEQGRNIHQIAYEVRNYVGSPDFLGRRGRDYIWYNNVFLFSNAIIQGIRTDIEVMTNPNTRLGWWTKTAMRQFIPKLLMWAGLAGMLGEPLKRIFEMATEYDKANYTIIPLGITKEGKALYVRIPDDEFGRFVGGVFWKLLNIKKANVTSDLTDLLSYTGGQLPSLAPPIEILLGLIFNYDLFRGREILNDDERNAGGWYAFNTKTKWTLGKAGVYALSIDYGRERLTWREKLLRWTPILNRYIRITDYGLKQSARRENIPGKRDQARMNLMYDEIMKEFKRDTDFHEMPIYKIFDSMKEDYDREKAIFGSMKYDFIKSGKLPEEFIKTKTFEKYVKAFKRLYPNITKDAALSLEGRLSNAVFGAKTRVLWIQNKLDKTKDIQERTFLENELQKALYEAAEESAKSKPVTVRESAKEKIRTFGGRKL